MAGNVHVFRLSYDDAGLPQYQANYTTSGNTYVRVLTGDEELTTFLLHDIALRPAQIETTLRQLHENGKSTWGNIEIPEHEVGAAGMEQLPDDS